MEASIELRAVSPRPKQERALFHRLSRPFCSFPLSSFKLAFSRVQYSSFGFS